MGRSAGGAGEQDYEVSLAPDAPRPLPPGPPGCQAGAEMSHSDCCPPEEPSVWSRRVTNRARRIETEFALWMHEQPGHTF